MVSNAVFKYFKKNRISLSVKMPLIFLTSYLVIAIIILLTSYKGYEDQNKYRYRDLGDGITNLMINALDTDKAEEYLKQNYDSADYMDILRYFHTLKDNYLNVKYLYVYRFHPTVKSATVIFDLDEEFSETPPKESRDWIGKEYRLDDPFNLETEKLTTSKEPVWHILTSKDGERLFSYIKPVYDENGEYVYSVCVDFSMTQIHNENLIFVSIMTAILIIAILIILTINIRTTRLMITEPIKQSMELIANFKYDTEDDRIENLNKIKELNIHTGDEIEDFYHSYISNMEESMYYMQQFAKADRDNKTLSYLAYKDVLTGVGNRADYNSEIKKIREMQDKGMYEYGIAIIDVNNLKYINDAYGHKNGDTYLKGCCKIICDTFKHSPVCRIGGDEFAIILTGEDYSQRITRFNEMRESFKQAQEENHMAWKRYSVAVGFSIGQKDKDVDMVVKEADKLMYKNKINQKKQKLEK